MTVPIDRTPFWHRGLFCFWDGDVLVICIPVSPETLVAEMEDDNPVEALEDYEVEDGGNDRQNSPPF